jgi:hypothetical protein
MWTPLKLFLYAKKYRQQRPELWTVATIIETGCVVELSITGSITNPISVGACAGSPSFPLREKILRPNPQLSVNNLCGLYYKNILTIVSDDCK